MSDCNDPRDGHRAWRECTRPDCCDPEGQPEAVTRRMYLVAQACRAGANVFAAMEAVSSTAIEHPEWDMDEKRTWSEWERS